MGHGNNSVKFKMFVEGKKILGDISGGHEGCMLEGKREYMQVVNEKIQEKG